MRGRVPLPPSVTEMASPRRSSSQVDQQVAVGQGLGVPDGVADQLGDHDARVVDGVGRDPASSSQVLSRCRATATEDAAKGTRKRHGRTSGSQ